MTWIPFRCHSCGSCFKCVNGVRFYPALVCYLRSHRRAYIYEIVLLVLSFDFFFPSSTHNAVTPSTSELYQSIPNKPLPRQKSLRLHRCRCCCPLLSLAPRTRSQSVSTPRSRIIRLFSPSHFQNHHFLASLGRSSTRTLAGDFPTRPLTFSSLPHLILYPFQRVFFLQRVTLGATLVSLLSVCNLDSC